jgi:predicted AAA+ superfamily ATPase
MVSKEIIKDIITENDGYISSEVGLVIARHGIFEPGHGIKKAKILYGTRRSGKTFILYDVYRKNKGRALYIDFEDERLSGADITDLQRIKDAFFELRPDLLTAKNVTFCFDEIQNIEGWEKFIRRLVERENINVWVAGSSSKITPRYIRSSLRGREWSIPVYPFSFKEYLSVNKINLADSVYGRKKTITLGYLDSYLKFGGYPEIALIPDDFTRKKVLDEYMKAMIFRDLIEHYQIKNIALFDALQEGLFSSFADKFSPTAFYKQFRGKFPFSKTSLFKYYNHFLSSLLVCELRIFTRSTYKRRRNPAKIYIIDMGLARKTVDDRFGRSLENLVFLDLKRSGCDAYYHEGEGQCDFIGHDNTKQCFALQVSWEITKNNQEREYQGLIEACKEYHLKEGLIITRDQEYAVKIKGVTINVIPYAKWLLTI